MTTDRIPWETIETFPSTDADLLARWEHHVEVAASDHDLVRSLVGRSLALYWATQEDVVDETWAVVARRRYDDLHIAVDLARQVGDPTLIAEALLGVLYGTWGPDHHHARGPLIDELRTLRPVIVDEEIRLRTIEWEVLEHLDASDLDAARRSIDEFTRVAAATDQLLFRRREVLWRGCLAMLNGDIDESLQINQDAISSTADVAGSPFSFQNVAISLAIERYLRRGLGDIVDALRSIRASSHRVAPNWDTGLAFALSEIGVLDEATELFERLAADRFAAVPRDLNWLVTMQLLGLIALTIDADEHGPILVELLTPFAHLDATHGSGYASYGPVGRVVGSLAARWGDPADAEQVFEEVLTTRASGPWTALTRLDRAVARRTRRPADALADARRAESELRSYGLDARADGALALADELAAAGHSGAVAIRRQQQWTLRHPVGVATVASSVGIEQLTWLLGRAGEPVDLADLDRTFEASLERVASAESSLDATALTQYRRRLAEIEARPAPSDGEQAEAGFLRRELSGARHVVSSSAELERLRVRVTKSLRRGIDKIASVSPELGDHLRASIETGRSCVYQPLDGQSWRIIRR